MHVGVSLPTITIWYYINGSPHEQDCNNKLMVRESKHLKFDGATEKEARDKLAHHLMNSHLHMLKAEDAIQIASLETVESYVEPSILAKRKADSSSTALFCVRIHCFFVIVEDFFVAKFCVYVGILRSHCWRCLRRFRYSEFGLIASLFRNSWLRVPNLWKCCGGNCIIVIIVIITIKLRKATRKHTWR